MQLVDERPVETDQGQVGTVSLLQGEIEGTLVVVAIWTNGNLYAGAVGGGDTAAQFYDGSSY